jgi:hypothetical protein
MATASLLLVKLPPIAIDPYVPIEVICELLPITTPPYVEDVPFIETLLPIATP